MFQALLDDDLRALESLKAGGGGGKEYATVVVAASNSHATGKATADFVCTGTNDETVIQQAVSTAQSLGNNNGCRVMFLEGDYNISASAPTPTVSLGSGTMIQGQGSGTRFNLADRSSSGTFIRLTGSRPAVTDVSFVVGDRWSAIVSEISSGEWYLVDRCSFRIPNTVTSSARGIQGNAVSSGRTAFVRACSCVKEGPVGRFIESQLDFPIMSGCVAISTVADATDRLVNVAFGMVVDCYFEQASTTVVTYDGFSSVFGVLLCLNNRVVNPTGPAVDMRKLGSPNATLTVVGNYFVGRRALLLGRGGVNVLFLGNILEQAAGGTSSLVFFDLQDGSSTAVTGGNHTLTNNVLIMLNSAATGLSMVDFSIPVNANSRWQNVRFFHNTFVGGGTTPPAFGIRIPSSKIEKTIIVGNQFLDTFATAQIQNSGTNTILTYPTGTLGNNFS
jgi:hypothetical protein